LTFRILLTYNYKISPNYFFFKFSLCLKALLIPNQHHLLQCQKRDHCRQISKYKYNKTNGKLTKFLIILSISIQTQRLTPLKSFIQLHAPSQYKTLTHYKLDSTSGRLVHWINLEICTCHTLWTHTASTQMNHQSCMTGLVPLRLSWPAIFQAAITQFKPPSTLTT